MTALAAADRSQGSARTLADGAVWSFLAEALALPVGLVTAGFLTRRLGADGYGLYTLAMAQVGWVEWTLASLFARATIQSISTAVADAEADTADTAGGWRPAAEAALWLHVAAGTLSAILLLLLAPATATLLGERRLTLWLCLLALDVPVFAAAYAHRNILTGIGRYRARASLSAARWIGRLLLVLAGALLFGPLPGAVAGSIGASVIELAVARRWIRPALRRAPGFSLRRYLDFALPLFLCAAALRLYDRLDLLTFKALGATAAQAGVYGAAQNLAVVPGLFAMALSPLLLSSLNRAHRSADPAAAPSLLRLALRGLFALLLPMSGVVAAVCPEIVQTIFGPHFAAAAPILAWLFCGGIGMAVVSACTAALTVGGCARAAAWLAFGMVLLAAPLYLLAVRSGPVAVAAVCCLTAWAGAAAGLALTRHSWKVILPGFSLLRGATAGLVAFWVGSRWSAAEPVLLLGKLVALAFVLTPAVLLVLGELTAAERQQSMALLLRGLRWRSAPA